MVFIKAGEPLQLYSFPLPELKQGEILVKNMFATICGSDVHTFTGKRIEKVPTVLGHEMIGRIALMPEDGELCDFQGKKLQEGDRVTWSVMAYCGECPNCQAGMPQKCRELKKYGHETISDERIFSGGFAEYTHLWAGTAIFKLSDRLPAKDQAWLNCAFATTMAAIRCAGDLKGKRVLITGAGALGLLVIPVGKEQGAARITVVDPSNDRRAMALEFGANDTYSPEELNDLTKERYDVIIEMSGQNRAINEALSRLAIGGVFVFVGSVFKQPDIAINPEQMVRNLWQLKGIHNYIPEDLMNAVNFLEKYYLDYPFSKITHSEFYKLEALNEAIEFAVSSSSCRIGISFDQ